MEIKTEQKEVIYWEGEGPPKYILNTEPRHAKMWVTPKYVC